MSTANQQYAEQYIELVRYIVQGIVGSDSSFQTVAQTDENMIRIDISLPSDERGRVIGRGGRVIRAIRYLVSLAAIDTHAKIAINIVD